MDKGKKFSVYLKNSDAKMLQDMSYLKDTSVSNMIAYAINDTYPLVYERVRLTPGAAVALKNNRLDLIEVINISGENFTIISLKEEAYKVCNGKVGDLTSEYNELMDKLKSFVEIAHETCMLYVYDSESNDVKPLEFTDIEVARDYAQSFVEKVASEIGEDNITSRHSFKDGVNGNDVYSISSAKRTVMLHIVMN